MKLINLPIGEIKVEEAERQRKKLGEEKKVAKESFASLKESIKANGLLQPIGVSREKELIYGYRRLQACIALGWTEVPTVVDPDRELSDLDKQVMELEENIQRLDLSWHERVEAIAKVDKIRQMQDPSHGQKRTAAELGIDQADVSRANTMAQMFEIFPELKQAKSLSAGLNQAKAKAKTVIRKVEVQSNPAKYEAVTKKVVHGKAEDVIVKLPDGFTHHILTDGPFGLDYGKNKIAEGAHRAYEDSPENYRKRTEFMAPHCFRIMKESGHMIWYLAHDHYEWTKNLFLSVGFEVDPVPWLWVRSEGRCFSQRPDKWLGKGFDIALHCIKGDAQLIVKSRNKGKFGSGNVFIYKPVDPKDKEHIVERPIELYQDQILCFSIEGEKITDFFSGSGKIAAAAASLKRDYFASEMDAGHVALTIQNIYANSPQEAQAK